VGYQGGRGALPPGESQSAEFPAEGEHVRGVRSERIAPSSRERAQPQAVRQGSALHSGTFLLLRAANRPANSGAFPFTA
jgi:hypothetical protein